jgi:hypothetical protein
MQNMMGQSGNFPMGFTPNANFNAGMNSMSHPMLSA